MLYFDEFATYYLRLQNTFETSVGRSSSINQGRLEKFRAEGQKFRLGPLASGAPKSSDEQKKRS